MAGGYKSGRGMGWKRGLVDPESLSSTRPWEALGIGRTKYYARLHEAKGDAGVASGEKGVVREMRTVPLTVARRGWSTAIIDTFGARHRLTWSTVQKAKREIEELLGYDIPRTFERGSDAESSFLMDVENIALAVISRNQGELRPAEALSASSQARLDAAVRRHQRELDRSFDERVAKAAGDLAQEHLLPFWLDRIKQAEMIVKAERVAALGFFTKGQWRQLLACLHPDSNFSHEAKTELFRMVKELESGLVKPDAPALRPGHIPLPKSVAEMMAMKLQRDEEERGKRAAAKAARVKDADGEREPRS